MGFLVKLAGNLLSYYHDQKFFFSKGISNHVLGTLRRNRGSVLY